MQRADEFPISNRLQRHHSSTPFILYRPLPHFLCSPFSNFSNQVPEPTLILEETTSCGSRFFRTSAESRAKSEEAEEGWIKSRDEDVARIG